MESRGTMAGRGRGNYRQRGIGCLLVEAREERPESCDEEAGGGEEGGMRRETWRGSKQSATRGEESQE